MKHVIWPKTYVLRCVAFLIVVQFIGANDIAIRTVMKKYINRYLNGL